jgi:F-type H+-transporting ATPase subunit epsilon
MDRAEERLRQRQSMTEYKQSKMALARAMARLQVSKRRNMR